METRQKIENKQKLENLGIDLSKIRGESGKTLCPKCSLDRKNKKDFCLSVDLEKGVYNCFAGDTKVITWDGNISISELSDKTVKVLTEKGKWVDAPFYNYGKQIIYDIHLVRDRVKKTVRTTAGHEWFVKNNMFKLKTLDLKKGHMLSSCYPDNKSLEIDKKSVIQGFILGDGCIENRNKTSRAYICSDKKKALLSYFEGYKRYEYPKKTVITGLPKEYKSLPSLNNEDNFLYGWLAGYFAADGDVTKQGTISLNSSIYQNLEFVKILCNRIGISTSPIFTYERNGYGGLSKVHRIKFLNETLSKNFFIINDHLINFEGVKKKYYRTRWKVENVVKTENIEDVFCCVVPETHSFTLDGNLLTSNCHHCDFKGGVTKVVQKVDKIYFKPVFNNRTELPKKTVDYFFKRGISQDTLLKSKVSSGMEWMPQKSKEVNTVQFNYFRDDELVNIKYRDAEKNFKLVKDAELIFYNLNSIKNLDWCIITEGEIDTLSFIESGVNECVSVPNGASKGSMKLDYLDNCYQYFENKKRVLIATDNDEPGRALKEEIARRVGYEICFWIDFEDCKDANEYLVKYGPEKLKNQVDKPKEFQIEGVFSINDVWAELEDVYENGLPTGPKTGDPQLDEHIGFMPGELTMVTGIPTHGKSIMLDQISLKLCLNAEAKFGVCSPESYPVHFYYARLIKRLLGKKFSKNRISRFELEKAREWISDRYSLIAPPAGYDLEIILEKARFLVLRKGIRYLIIDPWNRIEQNAPGGTERQWINKQLDKIIRFNQVNGVHTFLVAHPTKMQKEKDGINYLVPNLYSISGSGDFFNMTQNGMTVFHNVAEGTTELHIQKVKWEHLGKKGLITYRYHEENARFYLEGLEDPDENWLIKSQQTEAFKMPLSVVYNSQISSDDPGF